MEELNDEGGKQGKEKQDTRDSIGKKRELLEKWEAGKYRRTKLLDEIKTKMSKKSIRTCNKYQGN